MEDGLQNFLSGNQYSLKGILRYERIFGHTWISTGGEKTTRQFAIELDLQPGQNVLDVGCGAGGSALFLARYFGVNIFGVDMLQNMIQLSMKRKMQEDDIVSERVHFENADITEKEFEEESFDMIYSRDAIMHIENIAELFRKFYGWLKPGGKLFITAYCRGNKQASKQFEAYVKKRAYVLKSVQEYDDIIKAAGFANAEAVDATGMFVSCLEDELKFFTATRKGFIQDFSDEDYEEIASGWDEKIGWAREGYQAWGIMRASK